MNVCFKTICKAYSIISRVFERWAFRIAYDFDIIPVLEEGVWKEDQGSFNNYIEFYQ